MEHQPPILVLVTLQRACARLIRHGADMALALHSPLHVLHVVTKDGCTNGEPPIEAQVLDYLYALAGEAGAEMTVLTADVAVTAMAEFASQRGVKTVIMGGGAHACGIAETLSKLLPGVQVMITSEDA